MQDRKYFERLEEQRERVLKLIENQPENAYAHFNFGYLSQRAGDVESALDSYLTSLVLKKGKLPNALLYAGRLFAQQGEHMPALRFFDAYKKFHPAADVYVDEGLSLLTFGCEYGASDSFYKAAQHVMRENLDEGTASVKDILRLKTRKRNFMKLFVDMSEKLALHHHM